MASNNHVQEELNDHKSQLNDWISSMESRNVPTNQQGVVNRFVRDCRTLITDIDTTEIARTADLIDFTDRCNSLEIQFNNLNNDLK